MADVIELTHPSPRDAAQSALFKYLLDRRHHDDAVADPAVLPMLAAAAALDAIAGRRAARAAPRSAARPRSREAGISWERLSGWLPGGMDAEAWEAVIPSMGVMALVRNLRNFDQAGIGEPAVDAVIAKITDAAEVAKARLFPYQVWAAYQHAPSDNWKRALGRTLDLTVANIPALDGTLVVIDTSGSMQAPVSNRSQLPAGRGRRGHGDGDGQACRGRRRRDLRPATTRAFAGCAGTSVLVGCRPGRAVRSARSVTRRTATRRSRGGSIRARHRRAVIFTDDQQHDAGAVRLDHVPLIYTFNLAGYRPSALPAGERGRYTLGGFTDATFTVMQVLEHGRNAAWPLTVLARGQPRWTARRPRRAVSSMLAALTFSSRWATDPVPGMGSIAGDRARSHASTTCVVVTP